MARDSEPTCSLCRYIPRRRHLWAFNRGLEAIGRRGRQGVAGKAAAVEGKKIQMNSSRVLVCHPSVSYRSNQCGYALHLEEISQGVHTLFFSQEGRQRGGKGESQSQSKGKKNDRGRGGQEMGLKINIYVQYNA